MSKTLALNGFSEAIEDCVKHTAALMQLINRLSDAQIDHSAAHSVHDIEELTTAIKAISGAVRGVASVAQLEVTRNGL
jgi:uncharacterized protein YoxC